jgi:hypothetical protein
VVADLRGGLASGGRRRGCRDDAMRWCGCAVLEALQSHPRVFGLYSLYYTACLLLQLAQAPHSP